MLRLMSGYDGLRSDLQEIDRWYLRVGLGGADPFAESTRKFYSADAELMDMARFNVSRFFVSVRKLVDAGYLSEAVVRSALDARAMAFFVDKVDPLDRAQSIHYQPTDHEFYSRLLGRSSSYLEGQAGAEQGIAQ